MRRLRGAVSHRGDILEEDGPVLEYADDQIRESLGAIDEHPGIDPERPSLRVKLPAGRMMLAPRSDCCTSSGQTL